MIYVTILIFQLHEFSHPKIPYFNHRVVFIAIPPSNRIPVSLKNIGYLLWRLAKENIAALQVAVKDLIATRVSMPLKVSERSRFHRLYAIYKSFE